MEQKRPKNRKTVLLSMNKHLLLCCYINTNIHGKYSAQYSELQKTLVQITIVLFNESFLPSHLYTTQVKRIG